MLADPSPRRDRAARPVPLPGQRGPAPHRRAGDAAAQEGLGLLELPPGRRRAGRRHGHLLDEPAAAPRHAARLLRDPEPGGRRSADDRTLLDDHLRPPRLLPLRRGRPERATASSSATGARATAAPTGATASTRMAWSSALACASASERSCERPRRAPSTRAPCRTRGAAPARTPSPTACTCSTSTSTSCPARARAAPRLLLAASDYLGDPSRDLAAEVRDRVEAALGFRPAGPGAPPHPRALAGLRLQPGELLLLLRRGRREAPGRGRRDHQHPLGRAARLRAPGRPGRRATPPSTRRFHVSPFFPMEQTYDWRLGVPGRAARGGDGEPREGRRGLPGPPGPAPARLERRARCGAPPCSSRSWPGRSTPPSTGRPFASG